MGESRRCADVKVVVNVDFVDAGENYDFINVPVVVADVMRELGHTEYDIVRVITA